MTLGARGGGRPFSFVSVCHAPSASRWRLITARIISPSNVMSGPISHIAELSAEILEHILWYLSGQDIIKMEAVRIPQPPEEGLLIACLCDLGQPILPGSHSKFEHPSL